MHLDDPGLLFSSFVIGMIGFGLFLYGKKAENPGALGIGLVMCVFPYFVHSILIMWAIAAACFGSLYAIRRLAW